MSLCFVMLGNIPYFRCLTKAGKVFQFGNETRVQAVDNMSLAWRTRSDSDNLAEPISKGDHLP